jgi:hypothetical protein
MTVPTAPQITVLDTIFHGNNLNGVPVFQNGRINLVGWICFGPDEEGQAALSAYASSIRAGT